MAGIKGTGGTAIRFPEDKRTELKIEAAKRRKTMEEVVVEAYDLWKTIGENSTGATSNYHAGTTKVYNALDQLRDSLQVLVRSAEDARSRIDSLLSEVRKEGPNTQNENNIKAEDSAERAIERAKELAGRVAETTGGVRADATAPQPAHRPDSNGGHTDRKRSA